MAVADETESNIHTAYLNFQVSKLTSDSWDSIPYDIVLMLWLLTVLIVERIVQKSNLRHVNLS